MHTAMESTRDVALVRLGRSLCIFSLRCRSTLQRCPKKSDNHPVKLFYCFQAVSQTQRCTSPKEIKKEHSPDTTVDSTHQHTSKTPWPKTTTKETRKATLGTLLEINVPAHAHGIGKHTSRSSRQTGAVTLYILTEMQKHSPKVS